MRLNNITEVDAFIATVDKCSDDVWLCSTEGDRYNLKSKLSQYVALAELIGENADSLELFCSAKEDEAKFYQFFREHPAVC